MLESNCDYSRMNEINSWVSLSFIVYEIKVTIQGNVSGIMIIKSLLIHSTSYNGDQNIGYRSVCIIFLFNYAKERIDDFKDTKTYSKIAFMATLLQTIPWFCNAKSLISKWIYMSLKCNYVPSHKISTCVKNFLLRWV